jgi:Leucine-rich repeat (LRR) protein
MKYILILIWIFPISLYGQIFLNDSITESSNVDLLINLTKNNKESVNTILNNYIENQSLLLCKSVEIRCNVSIDDLPDNIFLLNWITSLKIVGYEKKNDSLNEVFDERFNAFYLLESLTLDYLSISSVSEKLNFVHLKEFRIISNNLSIFPESILGDSLETLVIQDNPIKYIPPSIKLAINLKEISFFNSPIEVLPPEFYELREIRCLNLEATNITKISDSIMTFTNLKYLNLLTAMFIDDIPCCLCDLPNLNHVSILYLGKEPLCFDNNAKWSKTGLEYRKVK